MDSTAPAVVIQKWRDAIGSEHVITDPASLAERCQNVSGLARKIPAILRPGSTDEVVQIVRLANECRAPIHPIGQGKNWGLGSAAPPRDGTALLELGRMDRVHAVHEQYHYATVEAGVTQQGLCDALRSRGAALRLNVTGSAASASVIGNALERGIGYFSTRAHDLSAMEIVMGNGSVIRTGFGHMPDPTLAHLYPYGIGPMLDGLFFQSNFGIVTSATVDLIPEPESGISIMAKIRKDADLEALVDAFAELRRAGVIRTVVHIGNRERTMITLGPIVAQHLAERVTLGGAELAHLAEECLATAGFGPWSAVVGVMGSRRDTRQALRTIKRRLKGLASVTMINSARLDRAEAVLSRLRWVRGLDKKLALLKSVRPLFDLSNGIPTDAAVLSVDWPVDNKVPPDHPNPDQGHAGMLYCLPFLPLSGACAREVVSMTRETCGKHGFTAYMTLNVVDSKSLECVTSISFDRDDDARAEQAQACIRTLQDQLVERGFYPYRVGLQYMDQLIDPEDTFWKTVRDLKQVLDPNHIISPGRYNLV